MNRRMIGALTAACLALLPSAAAAQVIGDGIVSDSGDTGFLIAMALVALVAVLPGWACYQAGNQRAASAAGSVGLMFGIVAVVSSLWLMIGYSLAFNGGSAWLGYGQNAWLANLGNIREGTTVPESAFALMQLSFALLPPLMIAGALAERVRTGWMLAFAGLWSLIVYAPVLHWVRGNGWLGANGTIDTAGGLTVFLTAGVSAIVAAVMLGRRTGWPENPMHGHAPMVASAGIMLSWIGWLALGGGAVLAAIDDTSSAIINLHLGGVGGVFAWLLCGRVSGKSSGMASAGTGGLAGIAALAAGADYIAPGPAVLLGFIGALLAWFAARSVTRTFRIDDVTSTFAIGAVAGGAGAILFAAFQSPSMGGVGYFADVSMGGQIWTQVIAVGAIALWSMIGTLIAGYGIAMVLPMRLAADDERGD